jgi:hypothetical protein
MGPISQRAIRVPLHRAFKGQSGPLVTAIPGANQVRAHVFEQFPS